MALFGSEGERLAIPSVARTVFDVSGAGDTVIAVLALALAAGAPIELGMQLANFAAGAVVEKLGTATASADEIVALVDTVRRHDEFFWPRMRRRRSGRVARAIAVGRETRGIYERVLRRAAPGHVEYLAWARAQGDALIVGLNDDGSVRALKGAARPIVPFEDRARILAALRSVDAVVGFSERTPEVLLDRIRPDVHVKSAQYREDELPSAPSCSRAAARSVWRRIWPAAAPPTSSHGSSRAIRNEARAHGQRSRRSRRLGPAALAPRLRAAPGRSRARLSRSRHVRHRPRSGDAARGLPGRARL